MSTWVHGPLGFVYEDFAKGVSGFGALAWGVGCLLVFKSESGSAGQFTRT